MSQGVCSVCHKYKKLYDNDACGGCQAVKAGEISGDWLISHIKKTIEKIFAPKK